MRLSDLAVLALIVVQTMAGLAAALWRSTTRSRQAVDLTDLTALSRSPAPRLRRRDRRLHLRRPAT